MDAAEYLAPADEVGNNGGAVIISYGNMTQRIYIAERMSSVWQYMQLKPILQKIIDKAYAAGKRDAGRAKA